MATAPEAEDGKGKKRRFSADIGKDVDHPHDDNAGTHTAWHDLHLPTFHRMTQKHTDRLRERLSTVGTLIEVPEGIKFPSCRFVLTVMAFLGFVCIYSLRVNLSVALVAMVNHTALQKVEHGDATNGTVDNCGNPIEEHKSKQDGMFIWDENMQGFVLGAFFYGYVTTNVLGGMMAERFGGKRPLMFGIFWTAALTILTPTFTRLGDFAGILATRILEGIGEGVTYPAMHAMLSQWAPPQERSKMVTFVYAGAQMGIVLTMPISGLLCEYVSWDSVFWVFGGLGVLWSVMWLFLAYDNPEKHPRIDPRERDYIIQSQGLLGTQHQHSSMKVPWKSIATSVPVWAVTIAHFTNNWGYYTLLTCLPTYLKNILHFDMKSNGLLSGVPYLVMWLFMISSGFGADALRSHHIMSTTGVRKLCNAIGFLGPGGCLIATGFIECNKMAAVAMIVIGVGLSGISMAGWAVNHLDLAPPYAGTLMGITNMIATIPGFLSPTVVGALTIGNQTAAAWRNVFYIAAGVYTFGTVFYCIFGSGQRQEWAVQDQPAEEKK